MGHIEVIRFIRNLIFNIKKNKKTKENPFTVRTWRIFVLWFFFVVLFLVLVARLIYVMILDSNWLISQGNDRVMRTKQETQERGIIKDRNGTDLAISVPVKAVSVNRKEFHQGNGLSREQNLREVANALEIDYDYLLKRLGTPEKKSSVYLARQISAPAAQFVASLKLPGFIISDELRRFYPTGEVNAHLIGRTNIDGNGVEGLEKLFNEQLLSKPGKSRVIRDRKGNVVELLGVVKEGKKADDIVLSIDERIQQVAYRSLKYAREINQATSASLVLLDAKTGEILALANSPSYNPNNMGSYNSYKARNRVVTDLYEPGSTTKPLIALGALERKYIFWNEIFDTRTFLVNGKAVVDSHPMKSADLFDIIKYSSNTGSAKIALKMQPQEIMDILQNFGYGSKTNLNLVGERAGQLPLKRQRWSKLEQATVGFGYGFMVTPLQIAQAYSIIANLGVKKPLSILRVNKEPEGVRVAQEKDVKKMLSALEAVVEGGGTGTRAMVSGYRIGGKTGTAKVVVAGKYGKDYVGTFAGIAPMSNPRFVLVVIINEPHAGKIYGGEIAGPVFSEVMSKTLQVYNIPPDDIDPVDHHIRTSEEKRKELRAKKYRQNKH
jgi:cell division protein FtsI (penicillin-binding protein 3)